MFDAERGKNVRKLDELNGMLVILILRMWEKEKGNFFSTHKVDRTDDSNKRCVFSNKIQNFQIEQNVFNEEKFDLYFQVRLRRTTSLHLL